jgi:transposase
MRDTDTHSSDDLTPKQHRAIVALMQAVSVSGAAQDANVSEATLYRWLSQTAFKAEYRKQRRMMFERAVGLAQRASARAMAEAVEIMQTSENDFARIAAIKIVLDFSRETDIEQRVAEIEEILDSADQPSDAQTNVRQLRSAS